MVKLLYMFPKISYLLVEKEKSNCVYAVGTFFRSEINDAKVDYEMNDAEVMEEGRFKSTYPDVYKKMFINEWYNFFYTFLRSLPFINYEEEIHYDEDNVIYYNEWFSLWQDVETNDLIFESSVNAPKDKLNNLIKALQAYCQDLLSIKFIDVQYRSIIDGTIYFGDRASIRMLAEPMFLYSSKN